jgi:hypothetical protein
MNDITPTKLKHAQCCCLYLGVTTLLLISPKAMALGFADGRYRAPAPGHQFTISHAKNALPLAYGTPGKTYYDVGIVTVLLDTWIDP